ncbi:MAG: CbiX/SirB N-terminal domain-containing protein [Cyanobacteriota bacterium]|nr:CbiX/SirB N-terminal domain-containing protein [Cyanobacteriota bacterium]
MAPSPGPPDALVAALPPPGSPDRWPWLQRLRRQPSLPLEPWLRALERGDLTPQTDLMAVLAIHMDGPAMARLLRWWSGSEPWDPALPALIVSRRDPCGRLALLQACKAAKPDPERQAALLPLLGHQRDPADFPLLCQAALEAGPMRLRLAALEGLCRGLSAWPRPALRRALMVLISDLHPPLAEAAVDALARLPEARPLLMQLSRQTLAPSVTARLRRRLGRLPAAPLVLILHGRAGGGVPAELVGLAQELEHRRGAPVILEALTAADPPPIPTPPATSTTLVPLFLLPGGHVRQDLPARLRRWRDAGPVRVLPFLGAWPAWQALLREEIKRLAAQGEPRPPLLLHHPMEGPLSRRYLDHLAAHCDAHCRPLTLSGQEVETTATLTPGPVLPLILAASRLSEGLGAGLDLPLLARPALRQGLLQLLEELP